MVDVNARFNYDANFGPLQAQIRSLTRDIGLLNASFVAMDRNARATKKDLADSFASNLAATGQFKTAFVDLTSSTEEFGRALQRNKLTLRQYFTEARKAYAQDSNTRRLAQQQVRMLQSQLVDLGEGAGGRRKGMVITPLRLDTSDFTTKMQLASQQYAIFNKLVQDGATQLINWGKNTQWAGRQLTVGLTVPLTLFGVAVSKTFRDVDKELTRFAKVYGSDLVGANAAATEKMKQQVQELAIAYSSAYGIAAKETVSLAADIAATGAEGQKLLDAVAQTTRLAVLGEVDRQQAMQTTLSIQSAFNQSTRELAETINFLNAVENQTSTTLEDFTAAIPKAGPVVRQLGGDVKDLALMLTAMREGGIPAAEAANAIKSGLASMINPTKAASERLAKLGVDIQGIVERNRGDLMPTLFEFQGVLQTLDSFARAKVIEELFGKYQFARISALFDNLNRQGSQTAQVMDLMGASSADLAKIANKEISQLTESISMRFTRAIEGFKAALLPIGEVLTSSVIPFIEGASSAVGKMIEVFNNLPGPLKSGAKLLLGLTAVAGPLIMLTGVFANFIGYAVKGTMNLNNFARRLMGLPVEKLEIMDEHTIAAAKSTDLLTASFNREADSLKVLNQQLLNYSKNLRAAAAATPTMFVPGSPARPVKRSKGSPAPERVVPGGYGGGDRIPALLEPGESVVTKEATAKYWPFISAMNKGNLPGLNMGTVFLGMAKRYQDTKRAKEIRETLTRSNKEATSGRFATMPVSDTGTKISSIGGRSSSIPGMNGIYEKDGRRFVVKTHDTADSALAEIRGSQLTREVFGLKTPIQELIKIKHPTTGDIVFAVRSPYDAKFATSTGKVDKDNFFSQSLASIIRRDKDLQPDNLYGDIVTDVGAAFVANKASQPRVIGGPMIGVDEQAAINFLMKKGGARRWFAEESAVLAKTMTEKEYVEGFRTAIASAASKVRKAIDRLPYLDKTERDMYMRLVKDLDDAQKIDWAAIYQFHKTIVPEIKKPPTAAAIAKKQAEEAEKARQRGEMSPWQYGMPFTFNTGGNVPGYGGGDRVPALLEPGEFVIRKEMAQKHKPFLRALNSGAVQGYAFGDEVVAEPGMSGGQAPRGMRRDLIHPSQHDAMRQIIDQIARRTGIILTEGQLRTFGQINLTHAEKDVRGGVKWFDPNNLLLASGLENNTWEQLTGERKAPRTHLISTLDSMVLNDPSLASVRDSIIVRDPTTGQITDMRQPRNPEQMRMVRAAIQQLLDDPDQRRIWGSNWRRESRRSQMVPIFMEILNERIGDRRTPGTRGLLTPELMPILEARRTITHGPVPYSQDYLSRASITGELGSVLSEPRTVIGTPATDRRSRPGASMTVQSGGTGGSSYRPSFGRFGRFPGAKPSIQYGGIPSLIHRDEAVIPLGPFGRSGFAVDSAGNVTPIDLDAATDADNDRRSTAAMQRRGMGGSALMNIGFAGSMLAGMTAMNGEVTAATTALTAFTTALMVAGTALEMKNMFSMGGGGMKGGKGAGLMGLGALGRGMQTRGAAMAGMGGMRGLLGAGLLRGGMGVAALGGPIGMGVAAAIAAVTLAVVQYNNIMNNMKESAKSAFAEATKSAEYFGIELGRSAERAEEFSQIVEQLGLSASATIDQIDPDFISRVSEDYGALIERIKGSQNVNQVGLDLKNAYSSMIAQGFGADEAKAIVEEVARQAEQRAVYLKVVPELEALGEDPEKIAQAIVDNTAKSIQVAQKQINDNMQEELGNAGKSIVEDQLKLMTAVPQLAMSLHRDTTTLLDFAGAWGELTAFVERAIDPTKRFSEETQAAFATLLNQGETMASSYKMLLEVFKQSPQAAAPQMDRLVGQLGMLDEEQRRIFMEQTRESFTANVADVELIGYFDSLSKSTGDAVKDQENLALRMAMTKAASLGLADGLMAIYYAEGQISTKQIEELIQKVILLDSLNTKFDESLQEGIEDLKNVQKDLADSYDDKIKNQEKYIKGLNKEAEAAQDAYESTMDALDDEAEALDDRADKIRENAEEQQKLIDKQIKSLELKQEEASFDAQQRTRAFGMLGALASGDFAGYEQARLEFVQAQEDRTRELTIQNLQDRRDNIGDAANEKLKAIDKEREAIDDRRQAAADAHEAYMEQNRENIEAAEKRIQKLDKEKVKYTGVIQEQINLLENTKNQGNLTEKQVNDINEKLRKMGIKLPDSTKTAVENVANGLFGPNGEYTKVVNGLVTEMANALNVSEADVRAMLGNTLTGQFAGTPSSTGQNGTWWSRTAGGYTNRTGESPIPGRAQGGKIDGPGTPTSDSILARLSRGEYVIKADSVNRLGVGTLDHINNTGSLPGYAEGGYTGGNQTNGGLWGTGPNAMTILSIKSLQDLYTTAVDKINSTSPTTTTTTGQVPVGQGSQWLANFLASMGLSGEQLKVAYAIAMRESSGQPNLISTMDGNGYGLFQIQFGVGHANTLNTVLGSKITDNESDRQKFAQLMFDPINNFKVMMHMSRNLEDLGAWGLHSWRNPTLNTRDYAGWTASQHQAWIMEPFLRYYGSFPGVDANFNSTAGTPGAIPGVGTVQGGGYAPGPSGAGRTLSGWPAIPPSVAGSYLAMTNSPSSSREFYVAKWALPMFQALVEGWQNHPALGKGRLNLNSGSSGAYHYRMARAANGWSDHAGGAAVDFRYDILPAFSGYQMTSSERSAVASLLSGPLGRVFGWGGNYGMAYMDEMHFYLKPTGGKIPAFADGGFVGLPGFYKGGPADVAAHMAGRRSGRKSTSPSQEKKRGKDIPGFKVGGYVHDSHAAWSYYANRSRPSTTTYTGGTPTAAYSSYSPRVIPGSSVPNLTTTLDTGRRYETGYQPDNNYKAKGKYSKLAYNPYALEAKEYFASPGGYSGGKKWRENMSRLTNLGLNNPISFSQWRNLRRWEKEQIIRSIPQNPIQPLTKNSPTTSGYSGMAGQIGNADYNTVSPANIGFLLPPGIPEIAINGGSTTGATIPFPWQNNMNLGKRPFWESVGIGVGSRQGFFPPGASRPTSMSAPTPEEEKPGFFEWLWGETRIGAAATFDMLTPDELWLSGNGGTAGWISGMGAEEWKQRGVGENALDSLLFASTFIPGIGWVGKGAGTALKLGAKTAGSTVVKGGARAARATAGSSGWANRVNRINSYRNNVAASKRSRFDRLINLAARAGSPQEAETALRMAARMAGAKAYAKGGLIPGFKYGGYTGSSGYSSYSGYTGGTPTAAYARPSAYYYSTPAWNPYNKNLNPQYRNPVPTGRSAGTTKPYSTSGAYTADTAAMYSQNYSHKLPAYATTGAHLSYLANKANKNFGDTTGGRKWRQIASMLASPYNTPAKQRLASASRGIPTTEYWRTLSREQKDWLIRYATTGKGTGWSGGKPFRIMPWVGTGQKQNIPTSRLNPSDDRLKSHYPWLPLPMNPNGNSQPLKQHDQAATSTWVPNWREEANTGWDENGILGPSDPYGGWTPIVGDTAQPGYPDTGARGTYARKDWGWPWDGSGTKDNAQSPIRFRSGMTPLTTRTSPQEKYPIGMSGIYLGTNTWFGSLMEKVNTGIPLSIAESKSFNEFYGRLSPMEKSRLIVEMGRSRRINESLSYAGLRSISESTGEFDLVRRRNGGYIPGFNNGGSPDSILAKVSRGEYVMQSSAVDALGLDVMDKINSGKLPGFKTGGLIGGPKFRVPKNKEMISPESKSMQNIRGGDMIEYNINIDVAETNASADEIANKVMRQLKVNENSRRLRSNG